MRGPRDIARHSVDTALFSRTEPESLVKILRRNFPGANTGSV